MDPPTRSILTVVGVAAAVTVTAAFDTAVVLVARAHRLHRCVEVGTVDEPWHCGKRVLHVFFSFRGTFVDCANRWLPYSVTGRHKDYSTGAPFLSTSGAHEKLTLLIIWYIICSSLT